MLHFLMLFVRCVLFSFISCSCLLNTSVLVCSYVLSNRKKISWDINVFNIAINIPWGNDCTGGHNTVCILSYLYHW